MIPRCGDLLATMNLSMAAELAAAYKSGAQRTRVVTEAWGEENLYCPNCPSPKLDRLPNNAKANDFTCPTCGFGFQLKGQQKRISGSIVDGAYKTMIDEIRNDRTPNFFFMHYELNTWSIKNLLLIPCFAFPESAVIKSNPTTPKGRRHPWIGCKIALDRIPIDARIDVVRDRAVIPVEEVRERFRKAFFKPLQGLSVAERGWTLDVLNIVRKLGKTEFQNRDIYAFERELESLHPNNRNVRAQIRRRLQVLRDRGLLIHADRNRWQIV